MTESVIKTVSLVLLFLLCEPVCFAQKIQKWEGEASLGVTMPAGDFHDGEKQGGPNLGLKLRFNIPQTAWDCGLSLNLSTAIYKFEIDSETDWYWEQSNRSACIMAVGDYNFRQGLKFNPYLGMSMGLSIGGVIGGRPKKTSGSN